jgi:hypothetical protein
MIIILLMCDERKVIKIKTYGTPDIQEQFGRVSDSSGYSTSEIDFLASHFHELSDSLLDSR